MTENYFYFATYLLINQFKFISIIVKLPFGRPALIFIQFFSPINIENVDIKKAGFIKTGDGPADRHKKIGLSFDQSPSPNGRAYPRADTHKAGYVPNI